MLRVLPALERLGWRFTCWTPGTGPLCDELAGRGYPVAGEPRLLRYSARALRVEPGASARLRSVPGYLWRFRRWLREQAPSVLQANTLITIPEALVGRSTNARVLLYVHEILPAGLKGRVAGQLIRASAQAVITNSTASLTALRAAGVSASMSPYGIALPPPPVARRDGVRRLVVGTLGTVSHRKGTDVFLRAAER